MSNQRLIDANALLDIVKGLPWLDAVRLVNIIECCPTIEFLEIDDIGVTLKEEMAKRNMTEEDLIEYIKFEDECVKKGVTLKMVTEWIENAQTMKAEPVIYGKWNEAEDGDGAVCSICGCDYCTIIYPTENFNYCPNCGARMDGDANV